MAKLISLLQLIIFTCIRRRTNKKKQKSTLGFSFVNLVEGKYRKDYILLWFLTKASSRLQMAMRSPASYRTIRKACDPNFNAF